jgi:hypothetical protein
VSLPLRHVHENILIGHGPDRAAIYRLDPPSYPQLKSKKAWGAQLAYFAKHIGADFTVLRVNRFTGPDEYVQQALAGHSDRYRTRDAYEQLLATHARRLAGLRFAPEFYAIVRVKPETDLAFTAQFRGDLDSARQRVERVAGVERARPIRAGEVEALLPAEEDAHTILTAYLPARRATVREIQWLHRRAGCRGAREPLLDDHWQPNALVVDGPDGARYEPVGHELLDLGCDVREEHGLLEVHCDEGEYWQAFLCAGAMPDSLMFPGASELLFSPLERLPFPVDMALRCEWHANQAAIALVRKKIRDADNVLTEDDESEHGSLSWLPEEDAQAARALDARLRKDYEPMLRCSIVLALGGAETRKAAKKLVALTRAAYPSLRWHKPAGKQAALFADLLPRADLGSVRGYRDWFTVDQFAALMPVATHDLTAGGGHYFAHVSNGGRRPLLRDLRAAALRNRAAAIAYLGTTGSGKTVAAQHDLLGFLLAGGTAIDIDPKGDHHLDEVPWLAGRSTTIDLNRPDDYVGLLDPLVICGRDMRVDVAHSYLLDLLGARTPFRVSNQVRAAVVDVHETRQPCTNAVVDRLMRPQAGEDAHAAGEALATWARAGLARLAFSDGVAHDLRRAQLTTIRPRALKLPNSTVAREAYRPIEALSVATLGLLTVFAMGMFDSDRSVPKALLVDEGHFLLDTVDGRRMLSGGVRQGRANYVAVLIASQNIRDPGELVNLIGTVNGFGLETLEEARDLLELLGLDRDDTGLAEEITRNREGHCLIKDIDARIVRARTDIDPGLLRILDTNPGAERHPAALVPA